MIARVTLRQLLQPSVWEWQKKAMIYIWVLKVFLLLSSLEPILAARVQIHFVDTLNDFIGPQFSDLCEMY